MLSTVNQSSVSRSGSPVDRFDWYSRRTASAIQIAPYTAGSSSSSPTPARVISGLVLETTGCLATLEFRFQVDIVVELRDAVTPQNLKELASRHAKDLSGFAG